MTKTYLIATLLTGALALAGCSKSGPAPSPTPSSGYGPPPAAKAPASKEAGMPAMSLTDALSSKLGLTADQASAGVGSILAYAQTRLPAADFNKVAGAIPGASDHLQSAKDAGAVTGPINDVAGLNSAFGKLGISPEVAKQFIPQVTDYVSKVAGPQVGGLLKGLFP
jgi:uncharacterized protein VcgC/VcgE DUF2780